MPKFVNDIFESTLCMEFSHFAYCLFLTLIIFLKLYDNWRGRGFDRWCVTFLI